MVVCVGGMKIRGTVRLARTVALIYPTGYSHRDTYIPSHLT